MKTSATVTSQRVEIVATRVEEVVTLQMTRAEAETLVAILENVGGNPEKTRRGDSDTIRAALLRTDVSRDGISMTGSVYFNEGNS